MSAIEQLGAVREVRVWIQDDAGAPLLGATPTVTVLKADGSGAGPAATVTEIGAGFYRLTWSTVPAVDVVVLVQADTVFVPAEVLVGGYPDLVDAAVSTRARPQDVQVSPVVTVNPPAVTVTAPLTYSGSLG